ncbi:acyl-coenzyme A synthetase ACSM3, mitochondrial-like isoform X2 [Uloborus diversus]|uniref:acyl-coenzyme A synthetase ACSM3, mitochondrial-like isoform X2 n=1 Tax=Uloborus diversus TaxID=327109 RepID=UPI002409826D|nr:acyl-coenzyme A synthetase ACSM3, mitochondrial-like isoform X2 [Uloborus diversus]
MRFLTRIYRSPLVLHKKICNSSKLVPLILRSRSFSSDSRVGFNDYEKERKSWNVEIPEKFNFASDVIDAWAQREKNGQRSDETPAFWFVYENGDEIKWSFQDLKRETERTANFLESGCGIRRGDNVIVMLPKIPEFWLVNIAAIRIGFILSPASMQLTAKDVSYRLSALKPSCIIAHESATEIFDQVSSSASGLRTKISVSSKSNRIEKAGWVDFHSVIEGVEAKHKCADTKSDESMMIFFTSGTTGNPKMVEHSHSSYGIALADAGKYWQDLTDQNIIWNLSDTGWAKTAYSNLFTPWPWGACVFVHEMRRFSPVLTLEVLSKYPIDTLCAPPLAYRMMVQQDMQKYEFCKLSHCLSAGEALNPEVIKQWITLKGLKIYEGYGQTETVMLTGMFKCLDFKPGSLGKPAPGMDLVIIDENENELGPGCIGEISIRRREKMFGIFKGYKDDPEMTKKKLTEKYFHTGDVGYYDDDGYFWFVGRNDDLINCSGYRIGPFEVESALMEHPAVMEVAVTSSPDEQKGEIEFMKELPKTTSGKIKRNVLKKKEWRV